MNSSLKLISIKSVCFNSKHYGWGMSIRFYSQQKTSKTEDKLQLKVPEDYDVNKVTKEDLVWHKPWTDESKQYFKTLRAFYTENNNTEIVRFLQSPINLTPSAILNWLRKRQKRKDIIMQSYIPERNQVLGNELAAAHFTVYRGGAVKFHGQNIWIKANEVGDYNLPNQFERNWYLEGIDCSNMTLYYEGLQNFQNLHKLNWLSVNGCENIDDWCVDYICGSLYKTLVYLDLRNCQYITERGLTALWKMEKLKILYLDDVLRSSNYEMTVLMLQEYLPDLEIKVGDWAEED